MNEVPRFVGRLLEKGVELWPDGDQLRFRGPKRILKDELLAQIRRQKSEILKALTARTRIPLSCQQQAIWSETESMPSRGAFNLSLAACIHTCIDVATLRLTFQILFNRHAALRTTIRNVTKRGGSAAPVQEICGCRTVGFRSINASDWTWDELRKQVETEHRRPFEYRKGPLSRVTIFTRAHDAQVLLVSGHCVVVDDESLWQLLDEWPVLYTAMRAGVPASLPALEYSYADYVAWQAERMRTDGDELAAYWREQLADGVPRLSLRTDHPRAPIGVGRGGAQRTGVVKASVSETLTRELARLAQNADATLHSVLLAAFQVLLYRYAGQDDIVVISPVFGRRRPEFAHVVGAFTHPLPLRAHLAAHQKFRVLLKEVSRTISAGLEHQDCPLSVLIERFPPDRAARRRQLCEAAFSFQTLPRSIRWGELCRLPAAFGRQPVDGVERQRPYNETLMFHVSRVTPETDRVAENCELHLDLIETQARLVGAFNYSADLFEATTIERMASHFQVLLGGIVENPEGRLSELPLLTDTERQQILSEWGTSAD